MTSSTTPVLRPSSKNTRTDHKVLVVVLDGIGWKDLQDNLTLQLDRHAGVLPTAAFVSGNAVGAAYTPHLSQLMQQPLSRTLLAHGPSVGLPSEDDMGNSEVGHNALGAGRIFAQGAKLVNSAIESGRLFEGKGWMTVARRKELQDGRNTLHFCGLLSDGNVHSHIDHLCALIRAAKKDGVRRVRLHVLLDGRDVGPDTAEIYAAKLKAFLASVNDGQFDCQVASGGGRMFVTMDRYDSDWSIVERGYNAHVLGEGRGFASLEDALKAFRSEGLKSDQNLPPFVITSNGVPLGPVMDSDSFVFFNFRGDRAIQISRALTEVGFSSFQRKRFPKIVYAGMMQYDGDLKIPETYLVDPPQIELTMGELLSATGVKQFACSETQKYGHVTYFWNGNRSGKFKEALESYVEIPSDLGSFSNRPWMKSAEIADTTIEEMRKGSFRVGRINFANGDMVGHTGDFNATLVSVCAVDLALGRILAAAKETNTVVVVTADHGNADEMFEVDKKSGKVQFDSSGLPRAKTSHTLAPVPFAIFNAEVLPCEVQLRSDIAKAGLANVAATVLQLAGFETPVGYEPSLVELSQKGEKKPNATAGIQPRSVGKNSSAEHPKLRTPASLATQRDLFTLGSSSVLFSKTVAALRADDGCPWDKEQTIDSLRPYLVEEAYEAVEAAAAYALQGDEVTARAYCSELGDVLLQVFLNSQIASEKKHFKVADVFADITEKMIRRHPHVFETGSGSVSTADEVVRQWDVIKSSEKAAAGEVHQSLLHKAKKKHAQPTLNWSTAVSKSSWKLGFAWKTLDQTFADLTSEVEELRRELFVDSPDWQRVSDEMGDIVFALANVAVFLNETSFKSTQALDFDLSARASIGKFLSRFEGMEQILRERGAEVTEDYAKSLSLEVWDELWREAKRRKYR
ncbi:MAG: 2,3-bisphosphoglycerate-independent phosphoglycerate mutase [Silvanigrellaceae bacterium]